MTSFVHVTYPLQHPGVVRFERTVRVLRQIPVALAAVLAAIGTPVATRVQAVLAARRQARQDAQYWNLAQHDARLMADIQSAISCDALSDTRE